VSGLPLVSVLVTTYQSESTVGRLVDSLTGQVGRDVAFHLEILAYDDHSSDGTVAILAAKGIQAVVNTINSGGPNWGRNQGLRRARGTWISIADHDDEWVPNRIQSLLAHSEGVSILSSGFILRNSALGTDHVRSAHCAHGFRDFAPNEAFLQRLTRGKNGQNMYIGGLLVRSDRAHVLFEEVHGQLDFDWLLRLTEGCATREVCQPLFIRHVAGSNLSLNPTYRTRDFAFAMATLDQYAERYPSQVRTSRARWHGSYGRYWYTMGEFAQARHHFLRSDWSLAIIFYFATTFAGGNWIRKRFQIFG
jgi:glycosyltransferase involved in cell wall biosynthesis